VIPQTWTPYRRDEDDELLGYLVPVGDARAEPVTVFGTRFELEVPETGRSSRD
jgi:hypothetical protein